MVCGEECVVVCLLHVSLRLHPLPSPLPPPPLWSSNVVGHKTKTITIEVVKIWPNSREYLRFWRNPIKVLPLAKHSAPFWPKHLTSRVNANVVYVFTHYYSKVSECRTVRLARYTCFDNEVHDVSHRQRRHRIFIALDRVNVCLEFINMQNTKFFFSLSVSATLSFIHLPLLLSCTRRVRFIFYVSINEYNLRAREFAVSRRSDFFLYSVRTFERNIRYNIGCYMYI